MKKFFLPLRAQLVILSLSKDGVSLIIAIIFVSAFMLVMAGLFEARLRVIQAVGNREQEAKARYLAESAAELASYWAGEKVGANSTDVANAVTVSSLEDQLVETAEELGIDSCEREDPINSGATIKCIGFSVEGRAEGDSKKVQINNVGTQYYSVPMKATGNAGVCTDFSDANQACNWNKLYVGESIEVPLFYEEAGGSASDHAFDAPGKEFKLRVRSPCNDFTHDDYDGNCAVGERVTLYPPEGPAAVSPGYRRVEDAVGIPHDPVLIQWSISDVENTETSTLVARDDTVTVGGIKLRDITLNRVNTEISSSRINLAKSPLNLGLNDHLDNFNVLQYKDTGLSREKHFGKDLTGNPQFIGLYIHDLSKPVLRLNLVGQPQKDDGNPALAQNVNDNTLDIPYLEYQVLAKDIEISDSKSSIVGWAEIGGFRKEIRRQKQRAGTLGGFALESF